MDTDLFHIIGSAEWAEAQSLGRYAPESLAVEGFIHLSKRAQILRPANLLYQGREDLQLLVLDPESLRAEVVLEPGSHGENELFPHLYGQLNLDAVRRVVDFPCDENGAFALPGDL